MKTFLVLVVFYILTCGGGNKDASIEPEENRDLKLVQSILIVVAPQDFKDEEFKESYDLFTKSGAKVMVASTDTLPVKGMDGMVLEPDIKLEHVFVDSFDVLVVIGGTGCALLWDNSTLHGIIRAFNDANKTIAAICIAPLVLARAGILKGVEVTSFPSVKDDIGKCGGLSIDKDVVVCKNIITGSGPKASKSFAETILNELTE